MKKSMKKTRGGMARQPALNAVGAAVVATLIAGGAHAAEFEINSSAATVTVSAHDVLRTVQQKVEATEAEASNNTVGIDVEGTQPNNSSTVTGNGVTASATANTLSNTIDLSVTGSATIGDGDGAASLGVQTHAGTVSAEALDNNVLLTLDGSTNGSANVTQNSIAANAAFNSATSSVAGTVPGGYASTTAGTSNLFTSPTGATIGAQGSIAVGSVQQNLGGASSAEASDNTIALELTAPSTNLTVDAGPVLDNNSISATLTGNSARNTASVEAGEAPALQGSVVVTNLQENRNLVGITPTEHTASNSGALIGARVGDLFPGATTIDTLAGGLSVQGNTVSSAITGNEALGANGVAGNRIVLDDGMAFVGAGGGVAGSSSLYPGAGALVSNVTADLAIFNAQGNVGTSLTSTTEESAIGTQVQSLDGGTVTLAGNAITSAATGSTATSAIANGEGAASINGTIALGNHQSNYGAGLPGTQISASTTASEIGAYIAAGDDGVTADSSVAVSNNRVGASAYGNRVGQSIALQANEQDIGVGAGLATLEGGSAPDGNVSAAGATTISSLQANYGVAVSASTDGSLVGLFADSHAGGGGLDVISGSTLAVGGNRQEAVAVGNGASNGISLAGNNVGSGVGIANVQVNEGSPVTAALSDVAATAYLGTHLEDSTVSLTGNLQRAVGYGNSATNELAVSANSATVPAGGVASSFDIATHEGTVTAAYGLLNNQSALSDVSATAAGTTTPVSALTVAVEGSVTDSTVRNEGNTFVAAGYGNDASNAAGLALGSVGTGVFAPVANVSNAQAVDGNVLASATGGNVVATYVEDGVSGSSISTSGNTIQAQAFGNRAANALDASANTVDVASASSALAGPGRARVSGNNATVDAAFSVQNVQSGAGTVTATQVTGGTPGSAAQIRTEVGFGGDSEVPQPTIGSTIASNANVSTASATSNSADNSLALDANTLAGTSALQNVQTTSAGVNALIGLAGTPFIPGTDPTEYEGVGGSGTVTGGVATATGTTLIIPTGATLTLDFGADVTDAARTALAAYLDGLGFVVDSVAGTATIGEGTYDLSAFDSVGAVTAGGVNTVTIFGFTEPGTSAVSASPAQGGVILAVGGPVAGSTLSVNGNTTSGSVTGNSASNSSAVSANALEAGTGRSFAWGGILAGTYGAWADHTVTNSQAVTGGAALESDVNGTFAVEAVPDELIIGSSVSVSGNSQRSTAVANTAGNSLELSGGNVNASGAVESYQTGNAAVSANSDVMLFAPGAMTNSTVDISGNRNTALGVINDATNALTVTAGNVGAVGDTAGNAIVNSYAAIADQVLSNRQIATTSAASTATTEIYNGDQEEPLIGGLFNSSATVTGNSTVAEASANRADNSVALNASAAQGADTGLRNVQQSTAGVTADATTNARFALDSAAPALNQSSVTLGNNSTLALARGNAASNTMDVSAGSGYAPSVASAGATLSPALNAAVGGNVVFNEQANSGAVAASATANVQVALNGVGGGVTGSSVAVNGNTTLAEAYGNSATNRATVAALNTGTPSTVVASFQTNSGAVTATANGVNYGIGVSGASQGSTLRVGGNQIGATAVGNSAVSSILAR